MRASRARLAGLRHALGVCPSARLVFQVAPMPRVPLPLPGCIPPSRPWWKVPSQCAVLGLVRCHRLTPVTPSAPRPASFRNTTCSGLLGVACSALPSAWTRTRGWPEVVCGLCSRFPRRPAVAPRQGSSFAIPGPTLCMMLQSLRERYVFCFVLNINMNKLSIINIFFQHRVVYFASPFSCRQMLAFLTLNTIK